MRRMASCVCPISQRSSWRLTDDKQSLMAFVRRRFRPGASVLKRTDVRRRLRHDGGRLSLRIAGVSSAVRGR
jgi:hypothetical protein